MTSIYLEFAVILMLYNDTQCDKHSRDALALMLCLFLMRLPYLHSAVFVIGLVAVD
jgi:hypothetical protein